MSDFLAIILGFAWTTLVGGWWAAHRQQRSWEHQNESRLRELETARAAEVSQDLARLLDKRLYRMRRVFWAIEGHQDGRVATEVLDERMKDYNAVLYEWNDRPNLNLAQIGSHFGPAAHAFLYVSL